MTAAAVKLDPLADAALGAGRSALGPVARAGERRDGRLNVSFEFSPPKTDAAEETPVGLHRAGWSRSNPSFVSVTYGAGGSTRERTHRTVQAHPGGDRPEARRPPHLRRGRPATRWTR